MKPRTFLFWNGGRPFDSLEASIFAKTPWLCPPPARLRESAIIGYQWGETKFEIAAACCSLVLRLWGMEKVKWLHCEAGQTSALKKGQRAALMTVLVPTHYVTAIKPGSSFGFAASANCHSSIGVFPPVHPAPVGAMGLASILDVITSLLKKPKYAWPGW